MSRGNLLQQNNPVLNVQDITDLYLRKNFQNLREYFNAENQLLGFKFFELVFTGAQANYRFPHGLKTIPQDIIVTQITGPGTVKFNNGLFDATYADVTATGACRLRFYIGTYWNYQGVNQNDPTDSMSFGQAISSASELAGRSIVNQINVPLTEDQLASGAFTGSNTTKYVIRNLIDDVIYATAPVAGYTVQLPPASTCVGHVFTIVKANLDPNFNVVTILCDPSAAQDYIYEPYNVNPNPASTTVGMPTLLSTPVVSESNSKNTTLNSYLERIQIVSRGSFFQILNRDYYQGQIRFTPTWRSDNVQPSLGNGEITGFFQRRGQNIYERVLLLTGGTTSYGVGAYIFGYVPGADLADYPQILGSDGYRPIGAHSYHKPGVDVFGGQCVWLSWNTTPTGFCLRGWIAGSLGNAISMNNIYTNTYPSSPWIAGTMIDAWVEYRVVNWKG